MDLIAPAKYRWFVFGSLCVVQAVVIMIMVSPATLIGEISKTMSIDIGKTTALTMVVINVFVGISAFLSGGIIDRFGAYRIWIAGSCLLILGSILIPFIGNNIPGMLIVRFIQGCGVGPIMSTQSLVMAQWFPKEKRSILIGIQTALVSHGPIICMSFVPFVFQRTGSWETAMASVFIFSTIALALSLAVAFGPEPPAMSCDVRDETPNLRPGDLRTVLFVPTTLAVFFCAFSFSWTQRVFFDMIPSYLAVDTPTGLGLGPLKAGNVMSVVYAVFTVGAISSGIIMEKVFRGRVRVPVMIGFIIPAGLWFSIKYHWVYSDNILLVAALCLGGFPLALIFPLVLSFLAREYPEHIMGKLGGIIVGMSITGGLAGLGGGVYALHLTNLYNTSINLASLGALMGFVAACFLKKPEMPLEKTVSD